MVTLQSEDGRSEQLEVDPAVQNLDRFKVGDTVVATCLVTLTGPRGATNTVAVRSPDVQARLKNLEAGDEVDVTYTESLLEGDGEMILHRLTRGACALAAVMALAAASLPADAAERWWPPIVDPATGVHTPGRWVWADLVTSDVAKAAGFYGQLFGWTFETYGGEDDRDTYTLVLADGLPIGGMVFDPRAARDDKLAARWVMLLSVPDVTEAAKTVQRQGGEVVLAPAMLGERGETAVFRDTEGVLFGAVRSRNGDPGDYLGDLNEWVWLDLWTSDVERAAAFYRNLAGYEVRPTAAEGLRKGVHLLAGGVVRAGIMEKRDRSDTPVWLPYVRVADARATAAAAPTAGGKVLVAPVDVGRAVVAVVADPTGAPFGIAQLAE